MPHTKISDIAFTPTVKAQQEKNGSREAYERMMSQRDWQHKITPQLTSFLAEADSFYLATANQEGQPYIQHRGGPKGFVKIIDEHTIAFADYTGNKQYISVGNITENQKVHLFFMDYPNRYRIKVWGEVRVVEDDETLLEKIMDEGYRAKPERVMLITLTAWDINCPQHITPRYSLEQMEPELTRLKNRIKELEEQVNSK